MGSAAMKPAHVSIFSGLDAKGPAAIIIEFAGKRVLCDAGDGPEEDRLLPVEDLPPLDAIIVTHNHEDHVNALFRFRPACPVYATSWVQAYLPPGLDVRPLPDEGTIDLFGCPLTVGPTGHSPGGVWLHFALGGGLLYTGDFSREATNIPFAAPPEAATVLMDASYGFYNRPLEENEAILLDLVAGFRQVMLPLPLSGRAADVLTTIESHFPGQWSIEETLRDDLARHAALLDLAPLAQIVGNAGPFDASARILLTGEPHLHTGRGLEVLGVWEKAPEGRKIIFTGYVISAVEPLLKSGLATFSRWNVHPLTLDLRWLASHCKARHITPLFTQLDRPAWQRAFGSAFNDQPEFDLP